MAIRLSGINSGLDTDSIVQALVSSYSLKKTNLEKAQTKLSWKQEAWKTVNTKVYSFYTGKLSALRFSSAFSKKSASISDSSVAKVTASDTAVNGNQSLVVKQLASSGYMTGGVISAQDENGNTTSVTGSTKLADIQGMGDFANGGEIKVKADTSSEEKTIQLSSDMTVNQFIASLKSAGLSVNFDEKNQRFFINSKVSGADGDYTMEGGNGDGVNALKALGLLTASEAKDNYAKVANWTDDDIATRAEQAYNDKLASYNQTIQEKLAQNQILSYRQQYAEQFVNEYNTNGLTSAAESMDEVVKNLQEDERYKELTNKKSANQEMTDTEKAELDEYNNRIAAAKKVAADLGSDTLIDADRTAYIDNIKQGIADNTQAVTELFSAFGETYTEGMTRITTDYSANLAAGDGIAQSLKETYETQRTDAQAQLAAYAAAEEAVKNGTATAEQNALLGTGDAAGKAAVRIKGQDSEIILNGATFTSNTNNYSINGLTIQALSVNDESSPATITTDTDVDGIYNMIKEFFSEYNEVINYMDSQYNADSASGYEPLTDEEKEAMSDDEIEKWEQKIKDSILRKDDTLYSVSNQMKTDMLSSFEINGKKYSLSSFGIKTLGYFESAENEKGAYHIDGDKDDSKTSGNTDKLREAIANDPEAVISFFSQLAAKVYGDLTKKMSATSLSSAYTLYNDKQMNTEYSNYSSQISEWEDKITEKEDYYYQKFSQMETALATLNQQQSQLASYFG